LIQSGQLVSVIVATHNSERTLDTCLESIQLQDYRPIELIVVDNKSTDETLSIANRRADVVETFGPERSAQRNYGVRISHGEYILFVDSDMKLSPSVVSECVLAIAAGDASAIIIPEVSIGEGFLSECRALERSCYVGDDSIESARFFPARTFRDIGGYDEQLTAAEDRDLSIRVAAGVRLPRIQSHIIHDEGRLRLSAVLAKRRYYGATSIYYWRKHGRPELRQMNLVIRPAFVRNWRTFARHPVLGAGVLALKCLETTAVAWGLVGAWLTNRGTGSSNGTVAGS
jgi:glycosyltransferase involved in cell wall biosynthesis